MHYWFGDYFYQASGHALLVLLVGRPGSPLYPMKPIRPLLPLGPESPFCPFEPKCDHMSRHTPVAHSIIHVNQH